MRFTLVLFALLAACSPQSPAQSTTETAPVQAEAEAGPQRIVSIVPSATELLFALEVGDRVVARSMHCNFPPEVSVLPSIGSGLAPDVEQIIALTPDLIVATDMQADLPALDTLRAAGIDVAIIPNTTVADVPIALRQLGDTLGVADRADDVAATLEQELDALTVPAPTAPTRVAVVIGTEPLYVAGAKSFIGELVTRAGGAAVPDGLWVALDEEQLVALAPEVIVQTGRDEAALSAWARFGDAIPAVANERLCLVDPDELARPSVRMPRALAALIACFNVD